MSTPSDDDPSILQRAVAEHGPAFADAALERIDGLLFGDLDAWQPTGILQFEGEAPRVATPCHRPPSIFSLGVTKTAERQWFYVYCYGEDDDCGTVKLSVAVDGPVGGVCQCGWRFGTYDRESMTVRDDGSSIVSLVVELEEAVAQTVMTDPVSSNEE